MFWILIFAVVGLVFVVGISSRKRERLEEAVLPEENLVVKSPAFKQDSAIPKRYTGYGEDVSPALHLSDVDAAAVSIAIIMDDLDHPMGIFNHWVIWNIPASLSEIPEKIGRGAEVEGITGAIQGKSAYGGKHYYRGPKPPMGSHRYRFQVFVLDKKLVILKDSMKTDLMKAMQDHILQYGELIGFFEASSRSK